ncbi:peptide deformylase [Rhizobium paknamense]|uniref:Peptide deformylase-like n=1 Tax=Rhizobium paknamense TaxID=1206817 RepID=A0ABU0IEF5_9HYPH|nr:peptide deformylase [Rhizobium paknamense]MDQ0456067.1 peptide deformylase [Rhizobium paknamense]
MALTIVRYPHPALATVCEPVSAFDADLKAFADALYATMIAAPGIGITAAHVGDRRRLTIIDLPDFGGRRDFVNPVILSFSQETMEHEEGSVSMPGAVEKVTRPRNITLRYQTLDGEERQETASGFAAICLQHEIDQLDGIFWLQRLSRLKRDRLLKKWQKR